MQARSERKFYVICSGILFMIELYIALCVKSSSWWYGYGSNILIIPLIYCLIRIFLNSLPRLMPFLVCCIGFAFETAQYFQLSDRLGFERGSFMSIAIGTGFTWWDVACYIAGMLLIYAEIYMKHHLTRSSAEV